ncbi:MULTISPECIES: ABC-three component system protein [Paenibacillus]|uniref:ABC-three component system protein n=1 Tax=Paenibacillus TaxID=44249 RepID=UPI000369B3D5|nr:MULTISPECIES: ABC-three component system protein [Paenibacillus]
MQDNRRLFTDNEKMLLFNEVDGYCPICTDGLTHRKKGRIYKSFEVAHIYPANPLPNEVDLLKFEERLSDDVNDLKNVIAVCSKCHGRFDSPRTVEEYNKWVKLKKGLLQDAQLRSTYYLFNIESEIAVVLEKLQTIDGDITTLSYESLKIDEKTNDSLPFILKRKIKNDAVDYFDFIRNIFVTMDQVTPHKFDTLASQVKSFYWKCMQTDTNQEYIYNALVKWLDEKTDHCSRRACEIVIAFFVQDCEVFS